jgi:hypothetical protein
MENITIGNRSKPFVSVNEVIQAKENSIISFIFRSLEKIKINRKTIVSKKFKLNKRGQDHHRFPCAAGENAKIESIDRNNHLYFDSPFIFFKAIIKISIIINMIM